MDVFLEMSDIPTGILVNGSYGGFAESKEFCEKFLSLTGRDFDSYSLADRTDPVAIQLFHEMGEAINGKPSTSIYFKAYPAELLRWVMIHEYDGTESPYVNFSKAKEDILDELMAGLREGEKEVNDVISTATAKYDKIMKYIKEREDSVKKMTGATEIIWCRQ